MDSFCMVESFNIGKILTEHHPELRQWLLYCMFALNVRFECSVPKGLCHVMASLNCPLFTVQRLISLNLRVILCAIHDPQYLTVSVNSAFGSVPAAETHLWGYLLPAPLPPL